MKVGYVDGIVMTLHNSNKFTKCTFRRFFQSESLKLR